MAFKRFKISLLMQLFHVMALSSVVLFPYKRFQFPPAQEQTEKTSDFGLKAQGVFKKSSRFGHNGDFYRVHFNVKALQNYLQDIKIVRK